MFQTPTRESTVLIYSIHRTTPWWREVGKGLGYQQAVTVTDLRNDGDHDVVDDFYASYTLRRRANDTHSVLLDKEQVNDIIARCRLLRWLPRAQAVAMALAMADAFAIVLDKVNPSVILSFPIDRYVSDVLERVAKARGIPYLELTPGVLPGTSMLMYRGELVTRISKPSAAEIETAAKIVANPDYLPSYVPSKVQYTRLKFLKIISYFKARGLAFKAISIFKRDQFNLHYLDAQSFLGHKPKWRDIRITDMIDADWRDKLDAFPEDRRLFIGLPLFPEASIDYWIEPLDLIQYEALIVEIAQAFAEAGFLVLVKDHPLQFGFRQTELIDRLKAISGVVLVPYAVSGNEVLGLCGAHFTTTGTLGLQTALFGKKSVVTKSYYTTDEDFIILSRRDQVKDLPQRVIDTPPPSCLPERQYRIIEQLLRGTINEDLYSRNGFDGRNPSPQIAAMSKVLGDMIELVTTTEQWHNKNYPT